MPQAEDVPINTAVSVTFSQAMNPATITAATITLMDEHGQIVGGSVSYSGRTAIFAPTSTLTKSTRYIVTIAPTVQSYTGRALSTSYSFSFLTNSVPDTTAPVVIQTAPEGRALNVFVNTAVSVTFSEAMDPASITTSTVTLEDADGRKVSATVNYMGTTAVLAPLRDLDYNTIYIVSIAATVRDLAGNAMGASHSFSFTTGDVPDTTAPGILETVPQNAAADVAVNSPVSVTFSEAMDPGSITTATFTLTNISGQPVTGTVNYSGTTAIFTPVSNLDFGTLYLATMHSSVKDISGNSMAAAYNFSFTTITEAATSLVTYVTPAEHRVQFSPGTLSESKLASIKGSLTSLRYTRPNYFFISSRDALGQQVIVMVHELHYEIGNHLKRLFVAVPIGDTVSETVIIGLNGSNSFGNGAYDLFVPQNGASDFQRRWPLLLAARYGVPIIAPDSPAFGAYAYQASTSYEVVLDDLSGFEVGIDYLIRTGVLAGYPARLFTSGVSWGGSRSLMLGSIIRGGSSYRNAIYSASPQIELYIDTRDIFNAYHVTGFSQGDVQDTVPDMLLRAADRIRIAYGDGDYILRDTTIPLLDNLTFQSQGRIDGGIIGIGHAMDVEDQDAFFSTWLNNPEAIQ